MTRFRRDEQAARMEWLRKLSTDDLLAGLRGEVMSTSRRLVANGGHATLVRQVLRERGVGVD
jgi:hypothetical protein